MKISPGSLYFISDQFFQKIQDPYLKINYETTKRPHYFAITDQETGLYWLVPCSSKIEKFERLIREKQAHHKPADTIKIIKIFDKKTALLFQDMFPVTEHYIDSPYIKGGQSVKISDPAIIRELEKAARRVIKLLRRGIRFTPTQPDSMHIEKVMLEELSVSPTSP
ncbi:MAG: hypothetical protein HFH87_16060 [Lachnospiraceae bacterium]|nr:hypothetical protein [Lachnospiraceae bacterium]